jgi:hypothetical protein
MIRQTPHYQIWKRAGHLVMQLYWPKETPPSILPPGEGNLETAGHRESRLKPPTHATSSMKTKPAFKLDRGIGLKSYRHFLVGVEKFVTQH